LEVDIPLAIDQSILSKLPKWYLHLNSNNYLVLSNDFDSYLSCNFLKNKFEVEIGGFYSFDKGLYLNKERTRNKSPVYVDLSICYGMTFDNHTSFIPNPLAVNPNIKADAYHKRYNGGTLPLILSIYESDFSKFNEDQLTALLCVDAWYKGYYNCDGKFRHINLYWYEALGYKGLFEPILKSHDAQYFIDFALNTKLTEEIYIDEHGYLYSAVKNIELPTYKFDLVQPVTKIKATKEEAMRKYEYNPDAIFVSAETYQNSYILNLKSNLIN